MYDELTPRSQAAARRGMGARGIAAVVAAALLVGAALAAWVGWQGGWLNLGGQSPATAPQALTSAAAPPVASPDVTAAALGDASAKLATIEARMAELNREADAASGNATQAEALLVAFAARRTIERGQPLGYLEGQLRLRFGESQPGAVQRVIDAGHAPVTIDELSQELATLGPELVGTVPNETSWDWFKRQIGDLVVIRSEDKPSPEPQRRLDRARMLLAGGRVDAALGEIERLPGAKGATNWIARAKSYVLTQQALDQLETAAILAPQAPASVKPVPAPLPAAPSPSPSPAPSTKPATP